MAYRIEGLAPEPFAPLFELDAAALAARGACRVVADAPTGYPCRVSLADAAPGDELILVNHVSLAAATPYRASHAIFVRRGATRAVRRGDAGDYLERRAVGLRGFGADGMMKAAALAMPGEADARIRELLEAPEVAEIHAHTAARGCFLARIVRD